MHIQFAGKTDVGLKRTGNEDAFVILVGSLSSGRVTIEEQGRVNLNDKDQFAVFVVADGMGGAAAGEVASKIATESVINAFSTPSHFSSDSDITDHLNHIVLYAHQSILEHAKANPESEGMGTTINIGLIHAGKLYVSWCGDSRCYRYSPHGVQRFKPYDLDNLEIITPDHSVVWEMVEKGELTSEAARTHSSSNIITQSLGEETFPPSPDFRIVDLHKDDKVLICSDGLNGMMADYYISTILSQPVEKIGEINDRLIDAAKAGGGADNITSIVVEILTGVEKKTLPLAAVTPIATQQGINVIPEKNKVETSKEVEQKKDVVETNGSTSKEEQTDQVPVVVPTKKNDTRLIALGIITILLGAILGYMYYLTSDMDAPIKNVPPVSLDSAFIDSIEAQVHPAPNTQDNPSPKEQGDEAKIEKKRGIKQLKKTSSKPESNIGTQDWLGKFPTTPAVYVEKEENTKAIKTLDSIEKSVIPPPAINLVSKAGIQKLKTQIENLKTKIEAKKSIVAQSSSTNLSTKIQQIQNELDEIQKGIPSLKSELDLDAKLIQVKSLLGQFDSIISNIQSPKGSAISPLDTSNSKKSN